MTEAWRWFEALGFKLSCGPRQGDVTAVYHHDDGAVTTQVWPQTLLPAMAKVSLTAHTRNRFSGNTTILQ